MILKNARGQTTIEYLIILAVVIVIALVVVAVMGWFPGLAGGITEKESKSYWANTYPISVKSWKFTTTATDATLELQNMTTDKITVTGITTDTAWTITDTNFAAGQRRIVPGTGPICTAGETYQYDTVQISYDVIGGIQGNTLTGIKPIIGICP